MLLSKTKFIYVKFFVSSIVFPDILGWRATSPTLTDNEYSVYTFHTVYEKCFKLISRITGLQTFLLQFWYQTNF